MFCCCIGTIIQPCTIFTQNQLKHDLNDKGLLEIKSMEHCFISICSLGQSNKSTSMSCEELKNIFSFEVHENYYFLLNTSKLAWIIWGIVNDNQNACIFNQVQVLNSFHFQIAKRQLHEQEISILRKEIQSIEEISNTLPDFCPSPGDHCLEC